MAIDPQVSSNAAVAMAVVAILGQVITYFTKQSREPENGVKNQVKTNTENIDRLEDQIRECARLETIRAVEKDLRDGMRRLGTIEEKVRNNEVEIGYMRPRFHTVIAEQNGIKSDLSRLLKAEEDDRRRDRKS